LLKFPASDLNNQLKNITAFISENDRRFNPEGFS